jgi:uncharacterized integral membrane protein (TIGR00698 family)
VAGVRADEGSEALAGNEPRGRAALLPGLAVCGITCLAAAWISGQYGVPIILMGLLLGLALNFVSADPRTHPGLDLAGRTFLRIGIVLLGTQVTLMQIGALGPVPFVALLVVMASAIGAALIAARLSGLSNAAGLLAGGSTAICGASAALALYGVIGRERLSQAQFTLTLVGISLTSAMAMSLYPPLARFLELDPRQAGFLIGASIHDVAQAIGGGFAVSDSAGEYATIVKLTRVALLAPLVLLASLAMKPQGAQPERRSLVSRLAVPWFILGFLGLVCVVSVLPLPTPAAAWALTASKALLLLAVTATAMRTRVDLIMQMGWRAALPVLAATIASLLSALAFTLLLI